MPIANAETSARAELACPFGQRALPRWRDIRDYALQIASLALFFFAGLALTIVAPVLRLAFGRRKFRAAGEAILPALFRFYSWWLQRTGQFRLRCDDREQLSRLRGTIVAPNHPGLLDAIFLMAMVPRAACIIRAGLLRNPCLAGAVWMADYITNDRGPGLIRKCQAKLAAGDNLLIFPEGTRTRSDARGVNPFKSGFALAAVMTGAPIQTVLIERSGVYLGKETSLASMARIPIEITIRAGEIFHALPGESAKALTARLEAYFRERITNSAGGICLRR